MTDCHQRKELPPASAFANDSGDRHPEVAAALERYDASGDLRALLDALRGRRLLVPVLAHAADEHEGAATVVGISAGDGRVALPVFSSVAELAAWHADARPMPVTTEQAAVAAIEEGWQVLVLDAASASVHIGRPAVLALRSGTDWQPPVTGDEVSADVRALVADALRAVDGVDAVSVRPGRRSEVAVIVAVDPAVDRDRVSQRVQLALGGHTTLVDRVDSFEVAFVNRR